MLLTSGQAARILGVHERTFRRWRERGLVPYQRLPSGRYRYKSTDIHKLIREVAANGAPSEG
jgi:excisionase family DNA binding protein